MDTIFLTVMALSKKETEIQAPEWRNDVEAIKWISQLHQVVKGIYTATVPIYTEQGAYLRNPSIQTAMTTISWEYVSIPSGRIIRRSLVRRMSRQTFCRIHWHTLTSMFSYGV